MKPELTKKAEILRTAIRQITSEIETMNRELAPASRRKAELEDQIRTTHADGFNVSKAGERLPLFNELMKLSLDYGKVRSARAELVKLVKGYERELKGVERDIDREQLKDEKRKAKQAV